MGQTDGWIALFQNAPLGRGHNNLFQTHAGYVPVFLHRPLQAVIIDIAFKY